MMWVLDTNVISEMVSPRPSERVLAWMAAVPNHQLFTTAISEAELLYGVERMPVGRRREGLRMAINAVFDRLGGRVLPFESSAARIYARLVAICETKGRSMSQSDAQIGAISIQYKAILVTRNTRDFANSEIELLNPWLH